MSAEQAARQEIDRLLTAAGWVIQDVTQANVHAARGVAIREFPLSTPSPSQGEGRGGGSASEQDARATRGRPLSADYLLYIDGKAAGIVEAKKRGATLTGVEFQSAKYAQGLPALTRRPMLANSQLDDDFEYAPEELDRSVQTPDQIRTIAGFGRYRTQ